MTAHTLTALFKSRSHAERAWIRLRELGIPAQRMRIVEQSESNAAAEGPAPRELGPWVFNVDVLEAENQQALEILRTSNALHVMQRQATEDWPPQRWMGVQNGAAQTGRGVPPGQGDAEAGTAAASAADLSD